MGERLDAAFFARDVLEVAPELIGCVIHHGALSGLIVEVEAYHQTEPAAHSFRGITERTRHLFGPPGTLYTYFTYGMHWCANLVCEPEGVGAAALLRAVIPLSGVETMRERRTGDRVRARPLTDRDLCSGPGKLAQALGLERDQNGIDTTAVRASVWVERDLAAARAHLGGAEVAVAAGPRIGISQAVDLPWRFAVRGNRYLSRPI